jgi:ribosomal protein S18 acetylase RimI-like enzyme
VAVPDDVISDVADEFCADETKYDRYLLLYVLGLAHRVEYRLCVERVLDGSAGAEIAGFALKILCDWWGLADEYDEAIRRLVEGVDWDTHADAQQFALAVAAPYARDRIDRDLMALFLRIAADECVDAVVREDAVRALAVSMTMDLPPASRREPLSSDWSVAVVEAATEFVEATS